MSKYLVGIIVTVEVEINDPNVIARVLENHDDSGHPQPRGSEGERGWADSYYPMSTRDEVLQHLAFNCVANGVGDAARLDGWADLDADVATMDIDRACIDYEFVDEV